MREIGRRSDMATIAVVGNLAVLARAKHAARLPVQDWTETPGDELRGGDAERAAAAVLAERSETASWDNASCRSDRVGPVRMAKAVVSSGLPGVFIRGLGWDVPGAGGDVYIGISSKETPSSYVRGADPEFDGWFASWFGPDAYGFEGSIETWAVRIDSSRRAETLLAIAAAVPGSVVTARFGPSRGRGDVRPVFEATVREGRIDVRDGRSGFVRAIDGAAEAIGGILSRLGRR